MKSTPSINNGCLLQRNFLEKEQCDAIIDYFEKVNAMGFSYGREENHLVKDDQSYSIIDTPNFVVNFKANWTMFSPISQQIANAFGPYLEKYSVLRANNYQIYDMKIQKTEVGQGYHGWHDDGPAGGIAESRNRAVTFIIYLNDVEEGGETEMLYDPRRIKAEAGKLLIFPSNYMWTHRGNMPISNTKYILTGWIEYV